MANLQSINFDTNGVIGFVQAAQSLDVLLTMRNCAVNTLEFPAFIFRLWRIFIIQPRLASHSENYTDCAEISMISGGWSIKVADETAAGSYL